jgi:hypothetical protein
VLESDFDADFDWRGLAIADVPGAEVKIEICCQPGSP